MGMTNTSFKFSCKGKSYVYRHPGPGTELIINRKSEFDSMKIAKELGLDDTYIYMDKDMLKYEVPRQIYFVPEFVYTDNQKIRRDETVKKYKQ